MGTVSPTGPPTVPALLVLPRYWTAAQVRPQFAASLWLDEWQPWQFCTTVLPVAVHRAAVHRSGELAGDYGELAVHLAHLTPEQFRLFAACSGAKPFPLGPFGQPIAVENVYRPETERGKLDPADALAVVLTGAAVRAERDGDEDLATVCGLGATFAGLVTGVVSTADPNRPGESAFVPVWEGIVAAAEAKRIGPDDYPRRLADVPGFLADCQKKWPELFK